MVIEFAYIMYKFDKKMADFCLRKNITGYYANFILEWLIAILKIIANLALEKIKVLKDFWN